MAALAVPPAELYALAEGEVVVAFTDRPPDERNVTVIGGETLPLATLKPAYRRWREITPPRGGLEAEVVAGYGVALFDPTPAFSRHLRMDLPQTGHLLVLRVRLDGHAVLSDVAFGARLRAVTAALR